MQVRSHIDHGTVVIDTSKGPLRFNVDKLDCFHGKP
jgi:hypothetical protein